jgi:hypothetical protein
MTVHTTKVYATFECQFAAHIEAALHIEFDHMRADPSVGINEDDIDITEVRMQLVEGGAWIPYNGSLMDCELRFRCWEHLKAEREYAADDYAERLREESRERIAEMWSE